MTMTNTLWFRRTVISAAAVSLIGLATVSALRLSGAMTPQPGPEYDLTDFEAVDFEKTGIPNDENAAAWLQAGAGAIVRSDEEKKVLAQAGYVPYEEWSKELRREVRDALDRHSGALETMHMAANLERSSYDIRYSEGFHLELPDFLQLIDACRVLMLEVRVALADGNEQRTLTSLATMARLAESLKSEPTTITALVGIACERMMLTVAGEVVGSTQPWIGNTDFLAELEATIPVASGTMFVGHLYDGWVAVMELELNRWTAGTSTLEPEADLGLEELADVGRREIAHNRSQLLSLLDTPYGDDPGVFDDPAQLTLIKSERGSSADIKGFLKAIMRFQAALAQRQLVRAGIALRRHALEHGVYPAELPATGELTNPDPFTGRPLIYEPRPDGSLVLTLDGALELLEQFIPVATARSLAPITLPPLS